MRTHSGAQHASSCVLGCAAGLWMSCSDACSLHWYSRKLWLHLHAPRAFKAVQNGPRLACSITRLISSVPNMTACPSKYAVHLS